jgi:hypothetical protein
LKDGGHDDILSRYNLDGGKKHVVHYDVQDELCDPIEVDNEAMDYCETTERVSKKETIENGIKWMSEECFLAFTKYAEKINLKVCQSLSFIFSFDVLQLIVSLWVCRVSSTSLVSFAINV